MRHARLAVLATAALLAPATLRAQAELSGTVGVQGRYVWRGITVTNHAVVQPDLRLAAPWRGIALTLGAAANVEPRRYDAPSDLSENGGTGAGLTSTTLWLEGTRALGPVSLTVGAQHLGYPLNTGGSLPEDATAELYGAAELPLAGTLTVSVFHDLAWSHGVYGEVAGAREGSLARLPLSLTAAVGASTGQRLADGAGYFERDGLTHAQLGLESTIAVGAAEIAPSLTLVLGEDPVTRAVSATATRRAKLVVGATVHWSRLVGRRAPQLAKGEERSERAER
jgi:hypothetical protein